jgi:hypothetical protein
MPETALQRVRHGIVATVGRTRSGVATALARRDGQFVFAATALAYLVVYLAAVQDLALGGTRFEVFVVADPLARAFEPTTGPFSYEAIARIDLVVATYLFAPLNAVFGAVLAVLVGLNAAVATLLWRQPQACGVDASAGLLAGLPALLSGAACCGPIVLIVLGIQASGVLLTAFDALLPVAVGLLLVGLVLATRRIRPASV